MSESTTENETQSEAPKPTPPPAKTETRPPWGSDDEFNPKKAWDRITTQSRDIDRLRQELTEVKTAADAELQQFRIKAQEAEDTAQETALSLHRERAARVNGLKDEQLEFLAELTDPEQIDARAVKLAAMTAAPPSRPVDPTQGSTAKDAGQASTADQFAQAIEGAFTR